MNHKRRWWKDNLASRSIALAAVLSTIATSPLRAAVTNALNPRGVRVEAVLDNRTKLPTYQALLIGINKYDKWPPLQRPVQDVRELQTVLCRDYLFESDNVRLVLDQDATRDNIVKELERLLGLEEPNAVLIFFAGHGNRNARTGTGYWVPVEAPQNGSPEMVGF